MKRALLAAVVFASLSCVGTTGSEVVEFSVVAAGPANAPASGGGYEFDTPAGFHVRLSKAILHIGAVYLNRSRPVQGAQDAPCVLPGVYVSEMTEGADIDVLSSTLQPFPASGHGTADRALAGEVWLTGGRIDSLDDSTPILDLAGVANKGGVTYRFEGVITIGTNRNVPSADPATPGANPLCKLRIVTPIPVDLTPSQGGVLVVRAEPQVWFDQVDFSKLDTTSAGGILEFKDEVSGQPATTLFAGIRSVTAYTFEWRQR